MEKKSIKFNPQTIKWTLTIFISVDLSTTRVSFQPTEQQHHP